MEQKKFFPEIKKMGANVSDFVFGESSKINEKSRKRILWILAASPSLGLLVNEYMNYRSHGIPVFSELNDYIQLFLGILVGIYPAMFLNRLLDVLEKEKKHIDEVINTIPGGVLYRDADNNYIFINREARRIFGINEEIDVQGKNIKNILEFENVKIAEDSDSHALAIRNTVTDYVVVKSAAGPRNYIVRKSPKYDVAGKYTGMIISITDVEELHKLGLTDELTSIGNRRALNDHLLQTLQITQRRNATHPHSTKGAFMLIDVDSFKKINDQCGHLVGDGVLKAIAQVLAHNVRITDFVARYGGDEFGIVLPDVGNEQKVQQIANMFIKEFQSTKIDGLTPETKAVTGLSIGVSMFTGEESIENVIVSADAAVYHSKRLRDNQFESGTYRHGNIITHDK